MKDYHALLGLKPDASLVEVKRAFKELAFRFHPDRNPHNPVAEERFKELVEAYSYLTGNMEALRALQGPSAAAKMTGDYAQDILKTLFDIDHPFSVQDRPALRVEVALSLEEAFQGGNKTVEAERQEVCPECKGSGVDHGAKVFTCTYCFGAGKVGGPEDKSPQRECPKCNGRGFLSSRGCVACRARGFKKRSVKLKVAVPAGARDGQSLVLPNEGHETAPGRRGDALAAFKLRRHPSFSFDGKDIMCETSVEMSEAALGGDVKVPTLSGSTTLHLPPGTQSGQVFRIKGMGLGGDQFVKVKVKTPVALSEKDRHLLRRMQDDIAVTPRNFWDKIKKWFW